MIMDGGISRFLKKVAKVMLQKDETRKGTVEQRSGRIDTAKWNINMDLQGSRHVEGQFPIVKQGH